jgi:hypothetical protein
MKSPKFGKRHPLLLYRRSIDRLWKYSLFLGLVMMLFWGWVVWTEPPLIPAGRRSWLLAAGVIMLAYAVFGILARYVAYVQAHRDHLRVVTPFLQLRISYRRIRSTRPVELALLYPPNKIRGSQRSQLAPFYGYTAIVVEMSGYPLSPLLLRLFLPPAMVLRQSPGLVLLLPDWMAFSTELDSFRGAWLQAQTRRRTTTGYRP